MAKNMKPNGGGTPTAKHNVAGVHKVIRECRAQMLQIIGQREALNAEAAEIRQRLRDNGVQTKAFDFSLKVVQMETEAQAEYLDSLRVNFDAMAIGGQGEMFLDTVGEDDTADVAAAREGARAAGEKAALDGVASDANPRPATDHLHGDWHVGWMAGARKRAEEMRPKNAPATEPAKRKRARKTPAPTVVAGHGLTPLSEAMEAGKAAGKAGAPRENNPYEAGSQPAEYWDAAHKQHSKNPRRAVARGRAPTNPEPPMAV